MATAVGIGFIHTILGPDHYLPFVALAKQRGWRLEKTLRFTALCGIGHCAASIVLGTVGIVIGLGARELEAFQALRGDAAAWLLLAVGLVVFAAGLRGAMRSKRHTHLHVHANGTAHSHEHGHDNEHVHVHTSENGSRLHWSLFIIFLLGPCEALIPILMYPAAQANYAALLFVTLAFAVTTLVTMLTLVVLAMLAAGRMAAFGSERVAGPLAGLTIIGCAGAMLAGL